MSAHEASALEAIRLKSPEERLNFMLTPKWFAYEDAELILERMEQLLAHPPTHRMPGMQILGDSNNGKTALGLEFERRHPWDPNPDGDALKVPVVRIEMPPNPDEARLYEEILVRLRQPFRSRDSVTTKNRQVRANLTAVGCRMLMIDEFQHVLGPRNDKRRILIDTVKYLSNTLQIPIVTLGTGEAQVAISKDEQLSNRLAPYWLKRWGRNRDYQRLLASFELVLPLREKSRLQSAELGGLIHELSEGLLGETRDLLCLAVGAALRQGKETIDVALIQSLKWIKPSRRRERPARTQAG